MSIDGDALVEAVHATFRRRRTPIPGALTRGSRTISHRTPPNALNDPRSPDGSKQTNAPRTSRSSSGPSLGSPPIVNGAAGDVPFAEKWDHSRPMAASVKSVSLPV